MDIRRNGKKQKWSDGRGAGEDSGNGTDWKSDTGSISGAKFIQTPICENDDDDEMELAQYVLSYSSTLSTLLTF